LAILYILLVENASKIFSFLFKKKKKTENLLTITTKRGRNGSPRRPK
jgi:hypothetical protein